MSWERCAAGTYHLALSAEHFVPYNVDLTKANEDLDEAFNSRASM